MSVFISCFMIPFSLVGITFAIGFSSSPYIAWINYGSNIFNIDSMFPAPSMTCVVYDAINWVLCKEATEGPPCVKS